MGLEKEFKPSQIVNIKIGYNDGREKNLELLSRVDTDGEAEYYLHGGILHYVLRQLVA